MIIFDSLSDCQSDLTETPSPLKDTPCGNGKALETERRNNSDTRTPQPYGV